MTLLDVIEESYKVELRKIFRGTGEKYDIMRRKQFWMKFSRGDLAISEAPLQVESPNINETETQRQLEEAAECLQKRGFFVMPDLKWAPEVNFKGMQETMLALKNDGWPAAFIFMFDEPWKWIGQLYPVMGHFLERPELEASVHGWCLSKPGDESKGGVSDNFAKPHRDYEFSQCNTEDGDPFILVIWMPVSDSTLDNGCMYVLPKDADADFDNEGHRRHLGVSRNLPKENPDDPNMSELRFPLECVRPLPAPEGSVICWQGNMIHWGSKCSKAAAQPRMSIAMSFRVTKEVMPMTDSEINICGRAPLTQHEVLNLTQSERVSMVAKSLIMYAHWFPTFRGFDPSKVDVDTKSWDLDNFK